MKILYLHQYFNTPEMSGGTRSFEMARRFVLEGHEVHVITSWREPTMGNDWFETDVEKPEFTVEGMISHHTLTQPILSTPNIHLETPK
jgi:hypothetical protein